MTSDISYLKAVEVEVSPKRSLVFCYILLKNTRCVLYVAEKLKTQSMSQFILFLPILSEPTS